VGVLALLATGARPQEAAAPETIVEIRVHGNHTTADADVVRLSGLVTGEPFSAARVSDAEARLRKSGRFRKVTILKRYQSIEDPGAVVLVVLVEEQTGVSADTPTPGVLRRFKASTMWLPVLSFEDGYGFTYGVR